MAKVLYLRPTEPEGNLTLANEASLDEWGCIEGESKFKVPGKKCGEIRLGENETFWFNCTLCHERFLNVAEFCCHVKEVHIVQEAGAFTDPVDQQISIKVEETVETESLCYEMENGFAEVPPDSDAKDPISIPVPDPFLSESRTKKENLLKSESFAPAKSLPAKKTRKRKVISCEECGRIVPDITELASHMRVHTGEKPYQCEECGKLFRFLTSLNAHLIVHAGTRPYKCSVCGAGFAHPGSLRTHSFLHTGEKPYKCKHCDKAFVSTTSLKAHMRHHASEMPFICNICGKGFTVKWEYDRHMKRETNQRDFRCETCGKAFFSKDTLTEHMVSHANKKEFKCEICEARFNRLKTLREHQKLHMATKQHVCDICNREFAQLAGLHSHRKHHKRESSGNVKCEENEEG